MKHIKDYPKKTRPIRVLQFGGGVFLRGFFDWMMQKANEKKDQKTQKEDKSLYRYTFHSDNCRNGYGTLRLFQRGIPLYRA